MQKGQKRGCLSLISRMVCDFAIAVYACYVYVQITFWWSTGSITNLGDYHLSGQWDSILSLLVQYSPCICVFVTTLHVIEDNDLDAMPLQSWPPRVWFLLLALFFLAFLASETSLLALLARIVIACYLLIYKFFGHKHSFKKIKSSIETDIEPIKKQVIVKEEEPTCSVCGEPSLYDVCLTCEKKYQPELQRVRSQLYRAKKANAPATLTLAEWLHTLESFHWRCAYCQTEPYGVLEHWVPISNGGGTTGENCVPACYKCNSKKSKMDPGFVGWLTKKQNRKDS